MSLLLVAVLLAATPASGRQHLLRPPPPGRLDAVRVGVTLADVTLADVTLAGVHERTAVPRLRIARPAVLDSLPAGMPLHTRFLWGDGGLVRRVGLAPSTRAAELRLRRSMLQWHQRMGLVTLGALTAQVLLGERLASDRARFYEDLQPVHRTLGYVTFGTYLTTAGLSVFAPPGRRYSTGFSSIRLHRWLAVVHLTGMVAQPFLGHALSEARTADAYERRLTTHRWVGRITLGALTAAVLSTFLPY